MRIILLAAAVISAAAVATSAPARPVGPGSGHGGGSHGGWSNGGGYHGGKGGSANAGPGAWKSDGRRHGRFGRSGRGDFEAFGAAGIAGAVGAASPYGPGFFAGRGGQSRVRGGQAHYDYNRAYPYEWGSAAGGRGEWVVDDLPAEPPERCTRENGVRVCRGW